VPQHRELREDRQRLAQELQAFRGEIGKVEEDPGDVAARTREARGPPVGNRIGLEVHGDDRDRARGGLRRMDRGRAHRADRLGTEADELRCHRRQLIEALVRHTGDDLDLDFAPRARPGEALAERDDPHVHIFGLPGMQEADPPFAPRLGPGAKRPGERCPAEKRDELPAPHSMTSSARSTSRGGTSRPSAFAVLRLITSSNFSGWMTGRSAGFSPFRMRPT
jgi:hypothetical protein